ncbi:MAG: hypothetical protein ACI83N_002182, partial [Hydrogenophaga sp.]
MAAEEKKGEARRRAVTKRAKQSGADQADPVR